MKTTLITLAILPIIGLGLLPINDANQNTPVHTMSGYEVDAQQANAVPREDPNPMRATGIATANEFPLEIVAP